jgi:hypothetical protein
VTTPARERRVERLCYSIPEAAEVLGMGESLFRAEVLPILPRIAVGTRVIVDVEDLRRWVADHKDTASDASAPVQRGPSASESTVSAASSPRAKQFEAKLTASLERSTWKSSPESASVHRLPVSDSKRRSPPRG